MASPWAVPSACAVRPSTRRWRASTWRTPARRSVSQESSSSRPSRRRTSRAGRWTTPSSAPSPRLTTLAAGSVAVGAAALYLVLSGRVRNRLHESGVPLSLGLTRRSVVGQYLCEVLLVAAVAFALAVPTSSLGAHTMGGIGAGPLVAPRMALGQTLANPTAQSTTAARRAARHPARPRVRRSRARARHPAPAQAGPPPPQVPPLAQGQATARGSRDGGAPRP